MIHLLTRNFSNLQIIDLLQHKRLMTVPVCKSLLNGFLPKPVLSSDSKESFIQKRQQPQLNRLLYFTQVANYRKNFRQPINWVSRRGGGFDENMSAENRVFLNNLILEKYTNEKSPLKEAPWKRGEFDQNSINKRLGVIAVKLGSFPQWTKTGQKIYTTLLQVLDNHVIDYIPPDVMVQTSQRFKRLSQDGKFGMAIVGAISSDPRLYTKQYLDLFSNVGVPPKRKLTKFMISPNAMVQPGTPLYASHFRVGDLIDVGANTIGYGFQGTMKRWGFKGGPRSHGSTKFHRKRGSIGSGRDRKPVKGTKMAGRMGCKWRIQRGLKILKIDNKYNVLFVKGPTMPGPTHSYVRISDSVVRHYVKTEFTNDNHPPFPTFYPSDLKEPIAEEITDKSLHRMSEPTITFEKVEVKKLTKREGAKLAKIKN